MVLSNSISIEELITIWIAMDESCCHDYLSSLCYTYSCHIFIFINLLNMNFNLVVIFMRDGSVSYKRKCRHDV